MQSDKIAAYISLPYLQCQRAKKITLIDPSIRTKFSKIPLYNKHSAQHDRGRGCQPAAQTHCICFPCPQCQARKSKKI